MAHVDKLGPYIQQLMATAIESDDDYREKKNEIKGNHLLKRL